MNQFIDLGTYEYMRKSKSSDKDPDKHQNLMPITKIFKYTVKPVLSGHLRIDKTKVLINNDSLMKVESIAECSILQNF